MKPRPWTPEEWRDIMRLYWMTKCRENWRVAQPIIYIAPKSERNGNGRKS
jgi:hypothetical protein